MLPIHRPRLVLGLDRFLGFRLRNISYGSIAPFFGLRLKRTSTGDKCTLTEESHEFYLILSGRPASTAERRASSRGSAAAAPEHLSTAGAVADTAAFRRSAGNAVLPAISADGHVPPAAAAAAAAEFPLDASAELRPAAADGIPAGPHAADGGAATGAGEERIDFARR